MNNVYDLNSILNAIDEINNKKKNKSLLFVSDNITKIKKNISGNEALLPITEKLISEAEEYSKKIKKKNTVLPIITEDILILDKEYNEQNLGTTNFEEIKKNIIDDLYLSLSNKVKKNTLKIIFDLHQKIYDLEKKIEVISSNKMDQDFVQEQNLESINDNKEHLINEEALNIDAHLINEEASNVDEYLIDQDEDAELSEATIKTLKMQNSLIKNLEKNEEKLRMKIVDLEQDITILTNKKTNVIKNIPDDAIGFKKNYLSNETVDIQQKKIKTQTELNFFKENYERVIIDNDDLKKKLSISKERIIIFEQNIKELETALGNLNNILSKNSIIKLNEQPSKNPSDLASLEQNTAKKKFSLINNNNDEEKK